MKILAVDTSSTLASVSLLNGKEVLYTEDSNNITHSEKLLKLVDNIMTKEKLKIKDLDYLMVINGPGSFTGARIGVVTIKGLAIPFDKKIIALTSLEAMAINEYISLNTDEEKIICSLLDAKNSRAYYGIFKLEKINGKIKSTILYNISNDTFEDIKDKLYNFSNVLVISDIPEILKDEFDKEKFIIYSKKCSPNAAALINFYKYAEKETLNNHITDCYLLDIIYARLSQAERMKNEESK